MQRMGMLNVGTPVFIEYGKDKSSAGVISGYGQFENAHKDTEPVYTICLDAQYRGYISTADHGTTHFVSHILAHPDNVKEIK